MNRDNRKFNGGQILPQPPYAPKVRPSMKGVLRPRYNSSRTARAILIDPSTWQIEQLDGSDWIACGTIRKVCGQRYEIVGESKPHETLASALDSLD